MTSLRDLLARAFDANAETRLTISNATLTFAAGQEAADAILAALAADPETVEVLAAALGAGKTGEMYAEGKPYMRMAAALLRELTGEPHE